MVCQQPDFPTLEQVLEKLDIPLNMKSRISDPLQNLLKSLYNDTVLFYIKKDYKFPSNDENTPRIEIPSKRLQEICITNF
jgi:hypothetical protein